MNRFQNLAFLAALAAAATITFGTAAEAGVIGTVALVRNPPGVPFNAPEAALGAPWVGYTIGLATTAGELIGGVDVTITGQLHQRWTVGEDPDTGDPINVSTPNNANATAGDSHLRAVTGALFGSGPDEDNSLAGSPLANTAINTYGVGSFLKGAWGITNALTSANVAYIVIPRGSEVQTDIRVTVANPQGDIIGNLTRNNFPFIGDTLQRPPVITDADLGTIWLDMNNPPAPTTIMHQFVAVDDHTPISELTWSFESAEYAGTGTGLLNAPTLDANGKLSWAADGSGEGQYTFNVRATDAGPGTPLHDIGSVTVFLHVPEPTSCVLVGSALVGLLCAVRRRARSLNRAAG